MHTVVIYDSQFGNTERIARAIAVGLGQGGDVEVVAAWEALARAPQRADLLLVGGPTQRHGMSPTLRLFVEGLPRDSLAPTRAATFDTRYRMASVLSGSAAGRAASRLRSAGCRLVAPPESFFVERDRTSADEGRRHGLEHLAPGELERATAWGRGLAVIASSN